MTSSDNLFFEEYKRLNRLCADAYGCSNGVSEYISAMETTTRRQQLSVSTWDDDYRMLKRVRWVRNQLAHNADVFQISKEPDLTFVRDFYVRMLSGQDPLAQLRNAEKAKETGVPGKEQMATANKRAASRAENGKNTARLIGALVVLGLLAILYLLAFRLRFG